jgi:hypothetical protein
MSERPDFVGELAKELQQGVVRVAERRARRRNQLAAGAVVVGMIVVAAGTWRLMGDAPSAQIDATGTEPDSGTESTVTPPPGETEPDPDPTEPEQDGEKIVWLEATAVGDGTTMTRVATSDGSAFAVRLPEVFGTRIRQTGVQGDDAGAALGGDGFAARIEIGFCTYEPLTTNALGLPMAGVRLSRPPPNLSFCRPDEFVRLVIEPVPDLDFNADQFDIIPVSYGERYVEWIRTNIEPNGQCCFEDRGPMHHEGLMVVADGYGSTQVTGLDADTLVPLWTTDLAALLQDRGDWIGDSSLLLALTDSGTLITTTGYGFLVGLDVGSGDQLWIADLDGETPGGLAVVDENTMIVTSSIATEGDLTAPTVRLIDLRSGSQIWASKANEGTELQWTKPVVIDDLVVIADVPSYRGDSESAPTAAVTAFNVSTGERAWTTPLDSTAERYAPFETIVTDSFRGLLFVVDISGSLYRLDPVTGARIWSSTPGFGPVIGLSPDTVTVRVANREIDLSLETGQVIG